MQLPKELDDFRTEARAWLESVAEPNARPPIAPSAIVAEWTQDEEKRRITEATEWQQTKFDAGWAGLSWPSRYGGADLTPSHEFVYAHTEAAFDVPRDALIVGLGWVGPAIAILGTEEQKDRYLPQLLRGEEVWCQLFSEASAGSDLAGLETTAVRDGDEWILNGQKIWTTFAHHADWGLAIARHDPQASKHRGLSAFIVDMADEGVEPRPLRQITGGANFNVVFLDGARVPDSRRIGEVGDGWRTVITTFMFERNASLLGASSALAALIDLAHSSGRATEPGIRDRLTQLGAQARVILYDHMRSVFDLNRGEVPSPRGSISKLSATLLLSDLYETSLSLLGSEGMLAGSEVDGSGAWQAAFLGTPGLRIGGGTDAVQRNIIAERILGLPGDPRADRERPFAEVANRPCQRDAR